MKNIQSIFYITLFMLFTSCEDVVEIDLPEGEKRLVVEAWLNNIDPLQEVKLSLTGPYFENQATQSVAGATVRISDDLGTIYNMVEETPGFYQNTFLPEVGRAYTLEIITIEGIEYVSNPETMEAVPEMDEFYYEYRQRELFLLEGYYVFIGLKDPPGVKNFYRWKYYINGEFQNKAQDFAIQDDDLIDGAELLDIQYNIEPLKAGDTVKIEQYSLTEDAYNFLVKVREQITSGRLLFDAPPAPVTGNIINVNNPNETVLGYFGVSAVDVQDIVIEEE
ncbi:MAG: DUF4249 domain-containing protein [Bacteroidota bacterium]|nr:DUF4249 domain-containing protein [Bacteroidota bacterium]